MFGNNNGTDTSKKGVFVYLLQRESYTNITKIVRIKKVAKSTTPNFFSTNKCKLYASAFVPEGINMVESNSGMFVTQDGTTSQLWNNMFNNARRLPNKTSNGVFYKIYIRFAGISGITDTTFTDLMHDTTLVMNNLASNGINEFKYFNAITQRADEYYNNLPDGKKISDICGTWDLNVNVQADVEKAIQFDLKDYFESVDVKVDLEVVPTKTFWDKIRYARANEYEFFKQHYIRKISQQWATRSNPDSRYTISGQTDWGSRIHTIGNYVRSSGFFDIINTDTSLDKYFTYLDTGLKNDLGIHIRNWDTRDRCSNPNSTSTGQPIFPFEDLNDTTGTKPGFMYKKDFVSSSITLLAIPPGPDLGDSDDYKALIPEGIDDIRFSKTHKVIDLNKLNSLESYYYNAVDSNLEGFKIDAGPYNNVPTANQCHIKTLYLGIGYTQDQVVKSVIRAIDDTPRYYPNKGITLYQYNNYDDYLNNINKVNVMPNFNDSTFGFT